MREWFGSMARRGTLCALAAVCLNAVAPGATAQDASATDPAGLLAAARALGEQALSVRGTGPADLVERWDLLCTAERRLRELQRTAPDDASWQDLAAGRVVDGVDLAETAADCRAAARAVDACAECRETLLLREARSYPLPEERAIGIATVAVLYPRAELWDEAMGLVAEVGPAGDRSHVREVVLRRQAVAGLWDEARAGAEATGDATVIAATLHAIAKAQIAAGRTEEALGTATGISPPAPAPDDLPKRATVGDWALRDVAQGQAEAGRVEDALATAALISDPAFRTDAMGFAAVALAREGKKREALALLRRLPERDLRDGILSEMAVAEAKAGRKDDAFDTIRRIDHPPLRMDALVGIARDEADAGRFEDALATADLIEEWARQPALVAIAVDMADAGRIEDAEALAATIGPPMMYPKAWVPYTPPDQRPKATAAIEAARAREGEWERAVETARAIPDAAGRATALAALAVERPDSDALAEALAAALSVEEYWARADVLSRMAIRLAQAGQWAEAVMVTRDLGPSGLSDIVLAVHAP